MVGVKSEGACEGDEKIDDTGSASQGASEAESSPFTWARDRRRERPAATTPPQLTTEATTSKAPPLRVGVVSHNVLQTMCAKYCVPSALMVRHACVQICATPFVDDSYPPSKASSTKSARNSYNKGGKRPRGADLSLTRTHTHTRMPILTPMWIEAGVLHRTMRKLRLLDVHRPHRRGRSNRVHHQGHRWRPR